MTLCLVGPQTFFLMFVTNGHQMRPTLKDLYSLVFSIDTTVQKGASGCCQMGPSTMSRGPKGQALPFSCGGLPKMESQPRAGCRLRGLGTGPKQERPRSHGDV